MTNKIPDEWQDLLEGLHILARFPLTASSPFHCEHDTLTVMSDPSQFTEDQLAHLEDLGFVADDNGPCFISFRFGSA